MLPKTHECWAGIGGSDITRTYIQVGDLQSIGDGYGRQFCRVLNQRRGNLLRQVLGESRMDRYTFDGSMPAGSDLRSGLWHLLSPGCQG